MILPKTFSCKTTEKIFEIVKSIYNLTIYPTVYKIHLSVNPNSVFSIIFSGNSNKPETFYAV